MNKEDCMDDQARKQLIDKLMAAAGSEIRIAYNKENVSATGSKTGGRPAVPDGFVWPEYEGVTLGETEAVSRPLAFLCQINMKNVAPLDEKGLLPESGILSFFYELETMTWGFDPKDKGSARVYYFPDETVLTAAELPDGLEEYSRLPELAMTFEKHISIPDISSFDDDTDWDDYNECAEEIGCGCDDYGDRTKLLGYPDVIQNPMEEECEAVSRGVYMGDGKSYKALSESEKADIAEKAKDWIMLFEMGTVEDGDYELMFGDGGHIYFWIRKDDLRERNFNNIWLILQCG